MNIIAFFDLDYTLLNSSSGLIYLKQIIRHRRVPFWTLGMIAIQYRLGRLDFGQTHSRLITHVGKLGHAETTRFFETHVVPPILSALSPRGLEKIRWHQDQGHQVVLNSASIEEIVKPVARHLELDYLCTRLAVQNDRYTGQLEGPLCYGPGKVHWAKQWAAQNDLPFPQAVGYFYTDSSSDLPLLEVAQNPIAVNPSRKLMKIAHARGWPIEKFY